MYPIFSLIQTCRRGDRKDIEVRDKDRERDKERGATDLLQVSPSPCWTAGSKEKEGRRMERETGKRGKNTSALPVTFDLLKTVGV